MKTALVGNGLSIAYNTELSCPALLGHLTTRLAALGSATDFEATLSELAHSLNPAAGDGLEALLGPLDVLAGAVDRLGALAPFTSVTPGPVREAVAVVERYSRGLYRTGSSHVLEAIATNSVRSGGYDVIERFAKELAASSPQVSVATLNYDGLLHSGVLELPGARDLAAGYDKASFNVVAQHPHLEGERLRHRDDLQSDIQLINLHGSLGWLECDGEFVKFKIPGLREQEYWANWREGKSDWNPVVVLTNQQAKSRRVLDYPFHLAYSILEDRLRSSTHWLIAGYGFGDKALNNVFARASAAPALQLYECLVITRDLALTSAVVSEELGLPASLIKICSDGFPAAFDSPAWLRWKTS